MILLSSLVLRLVSQSYSWLNGQEYSDELNDVHRFFFVESLTPPIFLVGGFPSWTAYATLPLLICSSFSRKNVHRSFAHQLNPPAPALHPTAPVPQSSHAASAWLVIEAENSNPFQWTFWRPIPLKGPPIRINLRKMWATKKNKSYFPLHWLFNRDPYNGFYETIPI